MVDESAHGLCLWLLMQQQRDGGNKSAAIRAGSSDEMYWRHRFRRPTASVAGTREDDAAGRKHEQRVCIRFDLNSRATSTPVEAERRTYRNVPKKHHISEKICEELKKHADVHITKDILKNLFSSKRRQYEDEKRTKPATNSGSAAKVYTGKWQFYSAFTFLDQNCPSGPVIITGLKEARQRDEEHSIPPEVEEQDASVLHSLEPLRLDEGGGEETMGQQEFDSSPDDAAIVSPRLPAPRQHKRKSKNSDECSERAAALNEIATALAAPSLQADECRSFGKLLNAVYVKCL
ncbi:uncharacterized protein LOC135389227 [Ornithodoros turicata]|uniref:uncharacterized protein LOC135389227 n=1 Tax=Ornithodoros turicata TaxID=34597 RepID=UPI003139DAE3